MVILKCVFKVVILTSVSNHDTLLIIPFQVKKLVMCFLFNGFVLCFAENKHVPYHVSLPLQTHLVLEESLW